MRAQKKHVIIMSAERSDKDYSHNRQATATLLGTLQDLKIPYQLATGKYKDVYGVSVMALVKDSATRETLWGLAFQSFSQECVLEQETDGSCSLVYPNGQSEPMGVMTLTLAPAATLEACTILNNGDVFVLKR